MFKIIDKYITTELIKPFLMVVLAFIVVMISVRLSSDVDSIIRDKIPVMIVLKTIVYQIPDYIVKSLPIAYLMATLLTTSRFARDSETTALRASGVNFKRLMIPIITVSIGVSYIGFLISEQVIPLTNKYSLMAIDEFKRHKVQGLIDNNIYFRGPDNRFFHVQYIDRDRKSMANIVVADIDLKKDRVIVVAQEGTWDNKKWRLKDVTVQYYNKGEKFVNREEKFSEQVLDSKVNIEDVIEEQKNPETMTSKKLKELIDTKKEAGFEAKDLEIEYYLHYATAFATFFSATISAPLGFIFSRLGNYIGVALSIILIFIYYVAESIGRVLGLNGLVQPVVAAWASNIVFALNGLILLWRVDRR